jgi:heptosyltransferase-1
MKIAIVKLSSLGDIVHAMLALQIIKQTYPQAEIDWVVESQFAGLLEHNPDIHEILTVNLKALKSNKFKLFSEISKIKHYANHHYDYVIDAQGLIKSAITSRLLSSNCFGFDKNSIREKVASFFYTNTVSFPYDGNIIERNLAVLTRPLGIEFKVEQILNKKPFLFYDDIDAILESYFDRDKQSVLFVTGSSWPSKNYPKEHYLELINQIDADCLVCWGSESERLSAEWITGKSKAKLLPRLSFNQLKAVIANVDLVIGNDTGPTHMAWAMNRPSITLFGPTPTSLAYQTDINKVFKSPSPVNKFKLNKNDFSIKDIEVGQVLACAIGLLAEQR